MFDSRDDLQQSGFARAVAADQAGTFFRRDQPVELFKQKFMSEPFAGSGELQHLSDHFR